MADRTPVGEAAGGKGRYPGSPIGLAVGPIGGGKGGAKGAGEGRPWSLEGYQRWEHAARIRPVEASPLGSAPGLEA